MLGERVDVLTGGSGSTSWLLLVVPIGGIGQNKEGFLAIDLDVSFLATQGFSRVFNGRNWTMFLPAAMVSVATNRELGQLVVATRTSELYRSVPAAHSGYRGTVPMAEDGALTATIELSESAARALVRGTLPSPNPTAEVVMPLLAALLSCAVVLALYRAHGLAQGRAEFAASVTHELRTPLTQILLSAETLALERADDPKERTRILDSIVRESRRLVYLIENVLHFSRADRRMLRLAPRPTRVDLLVAEHLDDLQPLIDAANARIILVEGDALTPRRDRRPAPKRI
ncbi:MAG: histidine kinase dimerization/phospho-acceptor domain-containing protein [Gemmatimonadaceae bacterium]